MSLPNTKRQKVTEPESKTPEQGTEDQQANASLRSPLQRPEHQQSISPINNSKSHTPRKLILGQNDNRYAFSQPSVSSSSFQVPTLQPPDSSSSRGRKDIKSYSQSPPRSPGRSPKRRLELIQLSPVKNNRIKLRELYDAHNSQSKKERLFINKLTLNNFKSYAGQQVVGPFHTSFSAVVGPNGSGKSNVIDSMLFVFGFRANKMRQDRLSDLIHKSEKFPDLTSCSVDVEFLYAIDEHDGDTKISETKPKLVISRKAFKNNSSKYYINGKESNYTDVTKLLKEEGIDLDHKRFLILQGEVENIAQMKPKAEKESDDGLLEYLEDIIGTSKYKQLIEKDLIEIESLNEICIEKENRFEIVDREKNSLESGKNLALEFLEKEKQLTLSKSKLLQYNLWQNNSKLTNTLQKISALNEEYNVEKSKNQTLQNEINRTKQLLNESQSKIKVLEGEEKQQLKSKRILEGEHVSLDEKLKNLTQKKAKTEKIIATTEKTISSLTSEIQELEKSQKEYSDELETLNQQLQSERESLEAMKLKLKEKTSGISEEILIHEHDLEPWNIKVQEKKTEIQLVESQISLLQEGQVKLKNDIKVLSQEVSNQTALKIKREEDLVNLKKQQSSITKEISNGETECNDGRSKLKEMKNVLNMQRQRASEARLALANVQNRGKVLTALYKLQKSGRIVGFHGRLGDLGTIDNTYDVAVSTACPRLDDIVVETVECGQQCIEYLRKNKLGYARFILLDKLRSFNTNTIQTPKNVPRLFDLIKPKDSKFVPAFYSVLRDTLVAKDLKQANRVAYGQRRYRVVTLDGKLIDVSGTMSGGGNHVSKGLMMLQRKGQNYFDDYNPEDVEQIEKDLSDKEKNFELANNAFYEMENELQKLNNRKPEIELEISKIIMEIDTYSAEIKSKERQLQEKTNIDNSELQDNEELKVAIENLQKLKEEHLALQDKTKAKKKKIASLKEKIMKIGGIELQVQNSKVTSIVQRIDILTAKQKKDRTSKKKSDTELEKAKKTLLTSKNDITLITDDIKEISERIDKISSSLNNIDKSIEEFQAHKETLKDECDELKDKVVDLEENINEFKSFEIEVNNKLEKLNGLLNHIKNQIKTLEDSLSKLTLRKMHQVLMALDEESEAKAPNNGTLSDEQIHDQTGHELTNTAVQDDDSMDIDNGAEVISNGLPILSDDELSALDITLVETEVSDLEKYIESTDANIEVLEEYVKRLTEFKTRKLDLNDAVDKRETVRKQLEELKKTRYEEFMHGFGIISMTLKEMYQMITMGGNAELELVDSLDPFSEGVTFSVMPPKKSWRNISNLSGGEKTLSSLALVFALHKYKPTPLYVMDEIDAALDFRNVSIVANYIKERTKNAQFIVISLRNNMFELAQQLVGIYKCENRTHSATIKNREILNSDINRE
ncbi:hypothetical protein NCAS_0B05000 [Naumovozyma castellii]|uniref:Structural maintenance of chromosomes protein n=1 Tax=Naumovozyma castellii TaxID=27288 RepID=G0V9G8_NAUCA|nr:hypothetical protein NCAS_0B05000 [Naumovozyma castellii CBS 4309]CCC68584.1 hypothetical protein NCAS_0B05000 [Naumovozyma castellii CBS 4309]